VISRNRLVGLEDAVIKVNTFCALMELRTPAVAPSAPLIQKQSVNPAEGEPTVPIMLCKFSPVPTETLNVFEVADGIVTPAKLTPGLLNRTVPAPGNGPEIKSDCGLYNAFVSVRPYPLQLASVYTLSGLNG
jgi:hypothetical protein